MHGFLIQSPLEFYADSTPEKEALSCQGKSLSYASLDRSANRLANALLCSGARSQDRIGIFHHKALELGIAIYGILKAGCVFVPLDPFMPVDRLQLILDDCDIQHVVSSDALADRIQALNQRKNLTVYGVNTEIAFSRITWRDIQTQPDVKPDPGIIDQDLGYIMYTSGSTGVPKGMMHTHNGSVTYARWGAEHVDMNPNDRVASHAPLHFDLSIFDFFSTVQSGATVVLVPEAVTKFPASWTQTIQNEKISIVFTVPYTLIAMLEQGAMEKRDLSSLRWILFGGEPFPPRLLRQLMDKLDQVTFTNVYGPAEAPSCTCYDIPRPLPIGDEPLPIGTVSRNSDDIIVDRNDELCVTGQAGELCIRSSTLTTGYWNRPDLNAAAYLLRDGPGHFPDIYYRTGDRVVRHDDGQLRFLGRMDRMIKTRGHRVELDEVEAVLSSCSGVLEAAAFVVPDEHGSQLILAAVVVHNNSPADRSTLLQYLRDKLPPYAVPRELSLTDNLPHTTTGKIDRKSLATQWQISKIKGKTS